MFETRVRALHTPRAAARLAMPQPVPGGASVRELMASLPKLLAGEQLIELVALIREGVVQSSVATKPKAQGYWAVLALWQQQLGAPVIERIDTGITVVE